MALFKDDEPEGESVHGFDERLPRAEDEDDATEEIRRSPSPAGISKITFDDEAEDEHGLPDPSTYIRRRPTRRKGVPTGFGLGKATKVLGVLAGVLLVLIVALGAFGGDETTTTSGPTPSELAAANQQKIQQRAHELMRKRVDALKERRKELRANRAQVRREAQAKRARAAREKKVAAEDAATAETTTVSESEPTYTAPPTYTYTPPPAPAPEPAPAPAPAPEPAPVETQAQINQSAAGSSFGIGG
ncbi:MAG: hypothetical protein J0H98_07085 [Solirubrobacterales bacterium]|nr:hypothetical protein [Solirubrobacterales bacterium]